MLYKLSPLLAKGLFVYIQPYQFGAVYSIDS